MDTSWKFLNYNYNFCILIIHTREECKMKCIFVNIYFVDYRIFLWFSRWHNLINDNCLYSVASFRTGTIYIMVLRCTQCVCEVYTMCMWGDITHRFVKSHHKICRSDVLQFFALHFTAREVAAWVEHWGDVSRSQSVFSYPTVEVSLRCIQ